VALSHSNLQNYFTTIFSLAQHHKWSITEIENMIPFERDIYVDMLIHHLKEIEEAKNKSE
jgi:hypothetical protein